MVFFATAVWSKVRWDVRGGCCVCLNITLSISMRGHGAHTVIFMHL